MNTRSIFWCLFQKRSRMLSPTLPFKNFSSLHEPCTKFSNLTKLLWGTHFCIGEISEISFFCDFEAWIEKFDCADFVNFQWRHLDPWDTSAPQLIWGCLGPRITSIVKIQSSVLVKYAKHRHRHKHKHRHRQTDIHTRTLTDTNFAPSYCTQTLNDSCSFSRARILFRARAHTHSFTSTHIAAHVHAH